MPNLDLAHQVGGDVGGLGVDAATGLRQQGQHRGAEAEAQHHLGVARDQVDQAHAEQRQADHRQAHHRAGVDADREGRNDALLSRGRGADIALHGNRHAHVSGKPKRPPHRNEE
jgi:hypothetical protein